MTRTGASKLCVLAVLATTAVLAGIFLLPGEWSIIPVCYSLAWSQIALVWLAWRSRPTARRILLLLLSAACVGAHVLIVPWAFIARIITNGHNPPVRTMLVCGAVAALWSLPVWFGFLVAIFLRIVVSARRQAPSAADWLGAARLVTHWKFIIAALPAVLACLMFVSHRTHVSVREWVLVMLHPDARVVREYLDALEEGDRLEMARRMVVFRTSSQADGRKTIAVEYPVLEDFDGRRELADRFLTDYLNRWHWYIRDYYDLSTAYVAASRQRYRGVGYESGEVRPVEPVPGEREVVVRVRTNNQSWERRYFQVKMQAFSSPRIKRSSFLPYGIPEGCSPTPNLAELVWYDVDSLQKWLSSQRPRPQPSSVSAPASTPRATQP